MNNNVYNQFLAFIRQWKTAIIAIVIALIFIPFALSFFRRNTNTQLDNRGASTITTTPSIQKPFKILNTVPEKNAVDIRPGEILITLKTDNPVLSNSAYSLHISPVPLYPWKDTTSYPSTTIQAQIIGGLETNTIYTVSISNDQQQPLYSWSFTTSSTPNESSPHLLNQHQESDIKTNYPLAYEMPHYGDGWRVDYSDKLTLQVYILQTEGLSSTKTVEQVKHEVESWMISKGVNPQTHTIIIEDQRTQGSSEKG